MEKVIKKFLATCKASNKKRFDLDVLEDYVINHYKGHNRYLANGGYLRLYEAIIAIKNDGYIKEIQASSYNGLTPPLKTRWQTITQQEIGNWNQSIILQLSDYLDFTYYKNHPIYQTDLEWEYIENIYSFLKSREIREWASIEERSLELFYDEKFLKNKEEIIKGKYGILKRLKLSYADLKMKKYGEMFIYWNAGVRQIKNIIILENHSTFFAYKRMAEANQEIFGLRPDILIYGEGKKIENSFSFLEEITDVSDVKALYFGDVDSEGFGIYYRLKERYSHIDINLHKEAYNHLLTICNRDYPLGTQEKRQLYLDYFLEEAGMHLSKINIKKLKFIWENNFRIPQELINYEYLLKVGK